MFYRKHNRVTLNTGTELITKQSHKEECDINNILRQYQRTGIISHVQNARAQFLDLPSDADFQQSMHIVMAAQAAFADLPSKVRAHFGNDPAQFLAAFADPGQEQQLREFGLLNPRPESDPSPSAQDGAGTPSKD